MNADKRLGWIINQPSVLIAIDKVLGGHKKNGQTMDQFLATIDDAIVEAAKPPPVTRVFTKKPGDRLHVYEIEGDILTAIKAVRDEGYPRAMTLVPKATFQLGVKS